MINLIINKMKEENNNKSKNISIIISSNGNNKEAWKNLLNNIISNDSNINNDIISNIYQFLIEKTYIEINLDILDFIVQYGSLSMIEIYYFFSEAPILYPLIN